MSEQTQNFDLVDWSSFNAKDTKHIRRLLKRREYILTQQQHHPDGKRTYYRDEAKAIEWALLIVHDHRAIIDRAQDPPPCKACEAVREPVRWFAEQMERKLKLNDHKGGWSDCDVGWLLDKLQEEIREVFESIDEVGPNDWAVIYELADVANIAMMIADNTRAALSPTTTDSGKDGGGDE